MDCYKSLRGRVLRSEVTIAWLKNQSLRDQLFINALRVITIFLWLVIPLVRQCLEIHCDQAITIVLLKFQWLRHGQRSLQSTINSFVNTLHVQKWFHHWIAITWKSSHATNWKNSKYKIIDFCCHQIFDFFCSAQGIPCAERKKTQI